MTKPKFYEVALPAVLPEEQEWLSNYHENSRKLIEYMAEHGAGSTAYSTTNKCLNELRMYLLEKGISYSPEAGECWFRDTGPYPYGYQATLFRMADLFVYGDVQPVNAFPRVINHSKNLQEPWRGLLHSFLETLNLKHSAIDQIRKCVARFLYRIQSIGLVHPSDITFDFLEDYYQTDGHRSKNSSARYTYAIGDILMFMADNGLCMHGLAWYPYFRVHERILRICDLAESQITVIEELRSESINFPAEEFAVIIPVFLEEFRSLGYSEAPCKVAKHTLYNLLLFLEMHGLGYHYGIADIWLEYEKTFYKSNGWKQARRILRLFDLYIRKGAVIPQSFFFEKQLLCEELPPWCRIKVHEYMTLKTKEGWKKSTLNMIRSSVTRFCRFLTDQGVTAFHEIKPKMLKKFNRCDKHRSFEGKNACNGRIRKFIKFLEREGSVPYGLHQALYNVSAAKEKLIVTLTEEEKGKIQQKQDDCLTSMGLRDRAMLLLGLKMGLRASDVVTIQLQDINWEKQIIRVVQEKTEHEILLPMPTDVGNAIYLYITNGRPNTKTSSKYLFIKERVPYDSLGAAACTKSLRKLLPDRNIPGSGFHVTRKTFATDCLRAGAGKQAIADLLGQRDTNSLKHYLCLDEKRMRMCPLSLAETGLQMKGGRYGAV